MTLEEFYRDAIGFENIRKLIQVIMTYPVTSCQAERSFSALRRLYTWTRATMTEVRMKNLSRMHIHPNRMGAIKDSEVKELFLNAKPRRLEFGGSKRPFFLFGFNLLYSLHCRFIIFLFIIN